MVSEVKTPQDLQKQKTMDKSIEKRRLILKEIIDEEKDDECEGEVLFLLPSIQKNSSPHLNYEIIFSSLKFNQRNEEITFFVCCWFVYGTIYQTNGGQWKGKGWIVIYANWNGRLRFVRFLCGCQTHFNVKLPFLSMTQSYKNIIH